MMGIFDLVGRVTLNPGEIVLYSSDGGSIAASIRWNNDGSIDLVAPGDFNITANCNITGDVDIVGDQTNDGTIDATGDISSEADVISDSAATAISLTDHFHVGNLGYDTTPSTMTAGTAKPAGAPEGTATGNIDMNGNDIIDISGGTDYSTHVHSQGADGGGDAEVDTDPPS